jgi:hypothetical protein
MGKEENASRAHSVHHEELLILSNDPVVTFSGLFLIDMPFFEILGRRKGYPIDSLELVILAVSKPIRT